MGRVAEVTGVVLTVVIGVNVTTNGIVKAARVKIDRIELGGILVERVDGMVLPKGAMTGSLLGMSFLSRLHSFEVKNGVLSLRN